MMLMTFRVVGQAHSGAATLYRRFRRSSRLSTLFVLVIFCLTTAIAPNASQAAPPAGQPSDTSQATPAVYLPLLMTGARALPSPDDNGGLWLPYTTLDQSVVHTYGTNIAVDNAGGVHATYTIYLGQDNGQRPAYYAYCPAHCSDLANWNRTRLSDKVMDARLLLDPAGHPRVMMFAEISFAESLFVYQYAACDSSCTDAANWTTTPIAETLEYVGFRQDATNHYFALDRQGHPALLYSSANDRGHGGLFYIACTDVQPAACTTASNWTEVLISGEGDLGDADLVFTPDGQPRMLVVDLTEVATHVKALYIECNQDCTQAAGINLYDIGLYGSYKLRVDNLGRPRLGFYTGTQPDDAALASHRLYYVWCNTNCTTPSDWHSYNIGLSPFHGFSFDIVLDRDDQPRVAYKAGDTATGYAWCSANCESGNTQWQAKLVEPSTVLEAANPVTGLARCTISAWTTGHRPALALDPAGNPRIGIDTKHQSGGTSLEPGQLGKPCPVSTGITLARAILLPQP